MLPAFFVHGWTVCKKRRSGFLPPSGLLTKQSVKIVPDDLVMKHFPEFHPTGTFVKQASKNVPDIFFAPKAGSRP